MFKLLDLKSQRAVVVCDFQDRLLEASHHLGQVLDGLVEVLAMSLEFVIVDVCQFGLVQF